MILMTAWKRKGDLGDPKAHYFPPGRIGEHPPTAAPSPGHLQN